MKPAPDAAGCVVLLHGLGRSRASMAGMARYLRRAGYPVLNLGYPSRRHGIDHLVRSYLAPAVRRCTAQHGGPLHFVTHSLGGILLRGGARLPLRQRLRSPFVSPLFLLHMHRCCVVLSLLARVLFGVVLVGVGAVPDDVVAFGQLRVALSVP